MKKLFGWLTPWLVAALFLAGMTIFTRFFQLGQIPSGITWDEAALGYIGKMVITTGRDEHNDFLPITFRSFGDFKAPLAFYITGLSTTILGISTWATRLPFALAGVGSVLMIGWLASILTRNKWYGLLASWLLLVSPWHLLFSRVAFESGMALFFFLLMLLSWALWHQPRKRTWILPTIFVLSSVAFLYVYHSAKIVFLPTLALLLFIDWRRQERFWHKNQRTWLATFLGIAVLSLPMVYEILTGTGIERASQTTFIGQIPLASALVRVGSQLALHLMPEFLVQGATSTLRHGTGQLGVLLYSQFALLLLGITFALGRLFERLFHRRRSLWERLHHWLGFRSVFVPQVTPVWFWLVLLILTLIPAAIGTEIPHANRALLSIVPMIMLMVLGIRELQVEVKEIAFASIVGSLLLITLIEFSQFWQYSLTEYPRRSAEDWMTGYQQAVLEATQAKEAGKKVKFTTKYGEPQAFFAFYTQPDFVQYRNERIPGIEFGPVQITDLNEFEVVFAHPTEQLPIAPAREILRPDDTAAFTVYETP